MSLRHALLGLLQVEPASGYDLTKRFESELQPYAWHARHSQIYPELNKMAADGLVDVVEEGPRGRRTYAIAGAGRAELREWMMHPPSAPVARSESLLRMFLMSTLDPADARPLLLAHAEDALEQLRQLREIVAEADASSDPDSPPWFGQLAAGMGLRQLQVSYDWAMWAVGELDRAAAVKE